jgi:hypothetical protein
MGGVLSNGAGATVEKGVSVSPDSLLAVFMVEEAWRVMLAITGGVLPEGISTEAS